MRARPATVGDHGSAMAPDPGWNHNIHHHAVLLEALPTPCDRVLDVGCGEGLLTLELAGRARHVVGLDVDAPIVEVARRDAAAGNIEYLVGDLLAADLEPASFDAVVSVAALHHMDAVPALERMGDLVRPGGVVAVVGLARSRRPADLLRDAAGVVASRVHRLRKGLRDVTAPTVWPPPLSYAETRRVAEGVLPGVRYRRHVLFRYSLVWTKPTS
jgi:2-polyprenyl-3-methyl-5-hydroxy-6-metoxy-1,4-benzoquinol methylase